ncbi:MAG: hypothetical protein AAF242_11940 [Bacteroidota bacterium]
MKIIFLILFTFSLSLAPQQIYTQDEKSCILQINTYFKGYLERSIDGGRIDILTDQSVSPQKAIGKTHWITLSSKVRHNSKCKSRFGRTNGRWYFPDEGKACSHCGG